jgi:hypothetical protein
MDKPAMIQSILQVNTISAMTNADRLPKDRVRIASNEELFLSLVCLEDDQLKSICNELHIKT